MNSVTVSVTKGEGVAENVTEREGGAQWNEAGIQDPANLAKSKILEVAWRNFWMAPKLEKE